MPPLLPPLYGRALLGPFSRVIDDVRPPREARPTGWPPEDVIVADCGTGIASAIGNKRAALSRMEEGILDNVQINV